MIAISNCAAKYDALHPFFQGLTLSAPLHGISELRFCYCPLDGGRPQAGHISCFLVTSICPFLSRLHLCILPFGPCFHLHPVQPPCEVKTLRYREQKCWIYVSGFSQNMLKLLSLLDSHLNGKKIVLARGEKSGGDVFFLTVFSLNLRLLLLFICLKRRCFLILPMCTMGTQSGLCVSKLDHDTIALHLVSSGCSLKK